MDFDDPEEVSLLRECLAILQAFEAEDLEYQIRDEVETKETRFWRLYNAQKPRGTLESWNEDIGVPSLVLEDMWMDIMEKTGGFGLKDVEPLHLLWLLSWMRKHSKLRSLATEWNQDKTTFRNYCINTLDALLENLVLVRGRLCPLLRSLPTVPSHTPLVISVFELSLDERPLCFRYTHGSRILPRRPTQDILQGHCVRRWYRMRITPLLRQGQTRCHVFWKSARPDFEVSGRNGHFGWDHRSCNSWHSWHAT